MNWYASIKKITALFFTVVTLVVLISACTDETISNQVDDSVSTNNNESKSAGENGVDTNKPATAVYWMPSSGDNNLLKEQAYVESTEILTLESYPPQFVVVLAGTLPTPCNELRVRIEDPDEENRIDLEVYSVIEPDKMCVQVLEEFEENIPLGTPPQGYYQVVVNGEEIGEIGYE